GERTSSSAVAVDNSKNSKEKDHEDAPPGSGSSSASSASTASASSSPIKLRKQRPPVTGVVGPPGESTYKPPDPVRDFKAELMEKGMKSTNIKPVPRLPDLRPNVRDNAFTSPAFVRYTTTAAVSSQARVLEVTSLYNAHPTPMTTSKMMASASQEGWRTELENRNNSSSTEFSSDEGIIPKPDEQVPVISKNVGVWRVPEPQSRTLLPAEAQAVDGLIHLTGQKAPECGMAVVQDEFAARAEEERILEEQEAEIERQNRRAEELERQKAVASRSTSPASSPKNGKHSPSTGVHRQKTSSQLLNNSGNKHQPEVDSSSAAASPSASPKNFVSGKQLATGTHELDSHNATLVVAPASFDTNPHTSTTFTTETVFEKSGKGSFRNPSEYEIHHSKQLETPPATAGTAHPGSGLQSLHGTKTS
ncbi:unnamed protein product, partial [Amoebophrya sp. A120]